MTGAPTVARLVVVEGLVQGVGYREFTRRAAFRHAISGWVRNRADGTVEALLLGSEATVEVMLAEMRRGPRGASVTALRSAPATEPEDAEAGAFVVRSTL